MQSASRSKQIAPRPPEKGAFPLDHYGECKVAMEAYMRCLKQHEMVASCCLDESKVYMQCRMDRELMEREDMGEIGFKENARKVAVQRPQKRKEHTGFVSGTGRVKE